MSDGRYYVGDDLKFQITITADGFDQESDPYTIDFYCGSAHLTYNQSNVVKSKGNFYLFIPTEGLAPGIMKMIISVQIPDSDFPDGYRTEISVQNLGPLKSAM